MKFGEYLQKLRVTRAISKVALSKALKKTATYIHRLENNQSNPPTYELTQKISHFMQLKEKEHNNLLELAFLGRLQGDLPFYKHFKRQLQKKSEATLNSANISFKPIKKTTDNVQVAIIPNSVEITLETIPHFELNGHIKELIKALVTDTLDELNETIYNIHFTDKCFHLNCTAESQSDSIDTFVENIKSYTSAVLCHHLKDNAIGKYIWEKEHKVITH